VTQLAADAVKVQELLDRATFGQRQQFAKTLALAPPPLHDLILPLCPPALVVTEYSLTCAVQVGSRRSLRLSLTALPLNLGLATLYQHTDNERSTLTVQVKPVPVPGAALARAAF
jgi:hypothetical protein